MIMRNLPAVLLISVGILGFYRSAVGGDVLAAEQEDEAVLSADDTTVGETIPDVFLTEAHKKMCLVGVGDTLTLANLRDLKKRPAKIADLLGKLGTVVFFWKPGQSMSKIGLADLQSDVAEAYDDHEISIVGVGVDVAPAQIKRDSEVMEIGYTMLIDPQGQAFSQIGSKKLPRLFLLDRDGKILWFDIEYSLATRRELNQALRAIQPNKS
jgi:peroxiredoxin